MGLGLQSHDMILRVERFCFGNIESRVGNNLHMRHLYREG